MITGRADDWTVSITQYSDVLITKNIIIILSQLLISFVQAWCFAAMVARSENSRGIENPAATEGNK